MTSNPYQQWIGRTESAQQVITDTPIQGMQATLGEFALPLVAAGQVPSLWHWLYFLERASWQKLAEDGHQQRGEFLPPVDLPRRMWAGSRVEFHHPLRTGVAGHRQSKIESIDQKEGKSGRLTFVSVQHEIFCADQLAIKEWQTIVYRDAPSPDSKPTGKPAPESAAFTEMITPDPLLLFRYSALTFNAHRIHYDRPYATETEGYPGLVVHGPLMATLLVNLLTKHYPKRVLTNFEFRGLKPVFDLAPFSVCANEPDADGTTDLWVADKEGDICVEAKAKLTD